MKRFISILFILALAFTAPVQAQSISDVLKSFRKLEADTEAGMNYSEYARGLAEVNAQLKIFADMNRGTPPASIEALRSAFALYLKARALWDEQKLQDIRYENGELAIQVYFDDKKTSNEKISNAWNQAGQEIDRAAVLLNTKQRPKGKRAN